MTASDPAILFFDSWGGLWETCEPSHPDAVPGGPTGCARFIPQPPGNYTRARQAGTVLLHEDGWERFVPKRRPRRTQ